jgi:hypothetical protein
MKLYAWIGEDEFGSGKVGLKQHLMPCGLTPLVSVDREKLERPEVRAAMHAQARTYGVTIRLVSFTIDEGDPLVQFIGKH